MAEIYLARTRTGLGHGRHVVVKQILPHLNDDPGFAEMLIAEAKLAAQLRHANVAQVIDLGRQDGKLFITMEYVEGYDLHNLLRELSRKQLPLPAEFALLVVREVLTALDYAHRATTETGELMGIVHRDVSPSNVLISFEGEVKLCDFGIARACKLQKQPETELARAAAQQEESRILRTRVAGKSAYMAPEHARGQEIDERADLFAAGILLWELCAGRRLYKGSEAEMLEMARAGAVKPLPDRNLPEPQALQAVLDRALSVDPAERFQSAAQMCQALDDYAVRARLRASQLRFARFLTEHFAAEILQQRRARERSAGQELGGSMPVTADAPHASQAPVAGPAATPASEAHARQKVTAAPASSVNTEARTAAPEAAQAERTDVQPKRSWVWWAALGAVAAAGVAAAAYLF